MSSLHLIPLYLGASTGAYEACELRDGGDRYNGKGAPLVRVQMTLRVSDVGEGEEEVRVN